MSQLIDSIVLWQAINSFSIGVGFMLIGPLLSWCVIQIKRLKEK